MITVLLYGCSGHMGRVVADMIAGTPDMEIAAGIDTFVEIGPGKTLINMIKKIDQEVRIFSVSELDALLSEINNA